MNKRVRIPLSILEVQGLWPGASRDQIIRAYLIAYELLVLDVAEVVSRPKIPPLPPRSGGGEEPS